MRYLKTLTPCLLAACLLAAAPTALAGPVWRDCQKGSGTGTKYKDNKCTEVNGTGEYEYVEEKSSFEVNSKSNGEMDFTLSKVEVEEKEGVHEMVVKCKLKDKGTIGPGKEGSITSMEFESCTGPAICSRGITVSTKRLPWSTELYESGAETRIKFKGNPTWEVTCKTAIINRTITCEGETNAKIINTYPNVEAEFEGSSPRVKCNNLAGDEAAASGKDIIEDPAAFFAIKVF